MATIGGLVRLLFSDYEACARQLGLARYGESEILQMLSTAGFAPQRADKNIGHDQARMCFHRVGEQRGSILSSQEVAATAETRDYLPFRATGSLLACEIGTGRSCARHNPS